MPYALAFLAGLLTAGAGFLTATNDGQDALVDLSDTAGHVSRGLGELRMIATMIIVVWLTVTLFGKRA